MVKEIVEYIQKGRAHGLTDDLIRSNLITAGWDENSVAESFSAVTGGTNGPNAPTGTAVAAKPKPRRRRLRLALIALIFLILGGSVAAGYFFYGNFSFSPEKLWTAALENAANQNRGVIQFDISYHETLPPSGSSTNLAGGLTLRATGSTYFETNGQNLDSEISASISSELNGFNYNINIESRNIGNELYYRIANGTQNALSPGLGDAAAAGQWLRLDGAASAETRNMIRSLTQIQLLLKGLDLLAEPEYLGLEDLAGTQTAHFRAAIDNTVVDQHLTGTSFAGLGERLSFEPVDLWIDKAANQIKRMKFSSNFPAFVSGLSGLNNTPAKQRDTQRLADIRAFTTVLEQYKSANKRYPAAKNGLPELEMESRFAPKPPDGSCTSEQNLYWYAPSANGQDYELKFCLGFETSGYAPGMHIASASGILPEADPNKISNQKPGVNQMQLSGSVDVDLDFANAEEARDILVPANVR